MGFTLIRFCFLFLGSPPEKTPGSATKSSKKPAPIAIPTLASTFPFSVMHLLSAVRTALITNYGDGISEFHDRHDTAPYARERLDFDLPYATSERNLLGHDDQAAGASGVERGDSKEGDGDQRPHSFRGIPFSELVRRVHENPGDHRILETDEKLQVCTSRYYWFSYVAFESLLNRLVGSMCNLLTYCLNH